MVNNINISHKIYQFSFEILGIRFTTRSLKSTRFKNPGGGYPECDTEEGETQGPGKHFSYLICMMDVRQV